MISNICSIVSLVGSRFTNGQGHSCTDTRISRFDPNNDPHPPRRLDCNHFASQSTSEAISYERTIAEEVTIEELMDEDEPEVIDDSDEEGASAEEKQATTDNVNPSKNCILSWLITVNPIYD